MDIYFISALISGVYVLFKLFEMKYITKEDKGIKEIIRETIIIFICSVVGMHLYGQIAILTSDVVKSNAVMVDITEPTF